jgi:hypothetical protein
MNHRRVAVAALAAASLLALGACGDPDSPQPAAQAQPERGVAEATQRAADAHHKFQQAFEDAAANQRALEAHRKFQQALVEIAANQPMLDAKDHPRYNPTDAAASAGAVPTDAKDHPRYNPTVAAASPSAAPWWTQKR